MNKIDIIVNDVITIMPIFFKKMQKIYAEILQNKNITKTQLEILFLLKKEKILKMTELGKMLLISKPNITRLIDKLIKLEYLERIFNENDRRVISVRLTEKGNLFIDKYKNEFRNHLAEKLKKFDSKNMAMLESILGTLKILLNKSENKKGE